MLDPPLVVVTSPNSLTVSPNEPFTVNCTARAELDGHLLNMDIEWKRIAISALADDPKTTSSKNCQVSEKLKAESFTSKMLPDLGSGSGSGEAPSEIGHQIGLNKMEDDTTNIIIYRCIARTIYNSNFSDTAIFVNGRP